MMHFHVTAMFSKLFNKYCYTERNCILLCGPPP